MKYFNVLWLVSDQFALKISKHSPTTQEGFSLLSHSQLGCVWSVAFTSELGKANLRAEHQQHCKGRSWIIQLTSMHWKLHLELFLTCFSPKEGQFVSSGTSSLRLADICSSPEHPSLPSEELTHKFWHTSVGADNNSSTDQCVLPKRCSRPPGYFCIWAVTAPSLFITASPHYHLS